MNKRVMGPIAMILAAVICVGLAIYQVGKDAPTGAAGTYTAGTYTATAQGFGPDGVTVSATFTDAVMSAVDITGSSETPEIGGAAIPTLADAAMTAQSAEFDGVTGATMTSNAVKEALASCIAQAKGEPVPTAKPSEAPAPTQAPVETAPVESAAPAVEGGEVFTGKGQGFGPDGIVAELTMLDGKIAAVKLTGSSETPEFGGKALPELEKQVMAAQSADIDGVSGATLTSNAVRDAVTAAIAASKGETPAETPEPSETPAASEAPAESAAPAGAKTVTGKGKGYGGADSIVAELTLDGSKIVDVKLTGDKETPAIGGKALPELEKQVKAAQGADIDGATGATRTTEGVREAVAKALGVSVPGAKETPAPTPAPTPEPTPEPVAEPSAEPAPAGKYKAGTYTATAKGFMGDVTVTITVSADAITNVAITGPDETPGYGAVAVEELPAQIMAAQSADIDGHTGATFTSNAIKEALNAALDQAKA